MEMMVTPPTTPCEVPPSCEAPTVIAVSNVSCIRAQTQDSQFRSQDLSKRFRGSRAEEIRENVKGQKKR